MRRRRKATYEGILQGDEDTRRRHHGDFGLGCCPGEEMFGEEGCCFVRVLE